MFSLFGTSKKNKSADKKSPHTRPTKKKKNTYVVHLDNLALKSMCFAMSNKMPFIVRSINGQHAPETPLLLFPNPAASTMAHQYHSMSRIMDLKMACTIIEYLDKETGQPVLQLYPNQLYIFSGFEHNYMSRLNHASRRDLKYHIAQREQLWKRYNMQAR